MPSAESPTIEDVCDWLSERPSLDVVAERLRHLRLIHDELSQVVDLLRQHVLVSIGERSIPNRSGHGRTGYSDDEGEPF